MENMQFAISINTKDSKGNVTTLTQDLNNLRKAIELAKKEGKLIEIKGPDIAGLKAGVYAIDEVRVATSNLAKEISGLRQAGNEVKSFGEQLRELNKIREKLAQTKDPTETMPYSRIKGGAEVGINLEQTIKLIDMVDKKRTESSSKLAANIEKQRVVEEKAANDLRKREFQRQELIQKTIDKVELYNLKLKEGKFATESSLRAEQQALETRMRRLSFVSGEGIDKAFPTMPDLKKTFTEYQAELPKTDTQKSLRQMLQDQYSLAEQIIVARNQGKISAEQAKVSLRSISTESLGIKKSILEAEAAVGKLNGGLDKLGGFGIKLR